ncbi:hypothetical protein D3C71_2120180 [compost metagenome]
MSITKKAARHEILDELFLAELADHKSFFGNIIKVLEQADTKTIFAYLVRYDSKTRKRGSVHNWKTRK